MMLFVNFDGTSRLPGARFGGDAFKSLFLNEITEQITVDGYLRNNADVFADISSISATSNIRIAFGGEHSISYPLMVRHIKEGCKKIVIFDAHHDSYDFKILTHFSFVAQLLEQFDVEIMVVGARYELEKAHPRLIIFETLDKSSKEISGGIFQFIGNSRFYLSVELDVIDPSEWEQVSCPVSDGISIKDLSATVSNLCKSTSLVAIDVVEWNPLRGSSEMIKLKPLLNPILKWYQTNASKYPQTILRPANYMHHW